VSWVWQRRQAQAPMPDSSLMGLEARQAQVTWVWQPRQARAMCLEPR